MGIEQYNTLLSLQTKYIYIFICFEISVLKLWYIYIYSIIIGILGTCLKKKGGDITNNWALKKTLILG